MLTLIGTGHVFNIADAISFIVHRCWPDAVCVELDDLRYHALMGDREAVENALREKGIDPEAVKKDAPKESKVYRNNKQYQQDMAEKNGVRPGIDMITAIGAAKSIGAEVFCIDMDAQEALNRMWKEMGTVERLRYRFSGITDKIGGLHKVNKTQAEYYDDEGKYIDEFRKKYPVMTRILIDERNEMMAKKITDIARSHERTVVVCGDAHINGLLELIPEDIERRVVRLREMADEEKLKAVKKRFWDDES